LANLKLAGRGGGDDDDDVVLVVVSSCVVVLRTLKLAGRIGFFVDETAEAKREGTPAGTVDVVSDLLEGMFNRFKDCGFLVVVVVVVVVVVDVIVFVSGCDCSSFLEGLTAVVAAVVSGFFFFLKDRGGALIDAANKLGKAGVSTEGSEDPDVDFLSVVLKDFGFHFFVVAKSSRRPPVGEESMIFTN
jgi:hypothetical protein